MPYTCHARAMHVREARAYACAGRMPNLVVVVAVLSRSKLKPSDGIHSHATRSSACNHGNYSRSKPSASSLPHSLIIHSHAIRSSACITASRSLALEALGELAAPLADLADAARRLGGELGGVLALLVPVYACNAHAIHMRDAHVYTCMACLRSSYRSADWRMVVRLRALASRSCVYMPCTCSTHEDARAYTCMGCMFDWRLGEPLLGGGPLGALRPRL